jgi:hypothetical protein
VYRHDYYYQNGLQQMSDSLEGVVFAGCASSQSFFSHLIHSTRPTGHADTVLPFPVVGMHSSDGYQRMRHFMWAFV